MEPDPHQLEKWDPHQNFLGPPHWFGGNLEEHALQNHRRRINPPSMGKTHTHTHMRLREWNNSAANPKDGKHGGQETII